MGEGRAAPSVGGAVGATGYHPHDTVSATARLLEAGPPAGGNLSAEMLFADVASRDETRLAELADLLVRTYGIPAESALLDVATFVQRGQVAGLLSYHRRAGRVGVGARLGLGLLLLPLRGGISLPSLQRTYHPFTVARLVRHTAWSQVRIGLVVLLVALVPLGLVDGFWSRAGLDVLLGLGLGVVAGLVVIGVLHEGAHAVASRWAGALPHAIYRQGLRTGLQRERLGPTRDGLVALAGPLVGIVAGCALVLVAMAVDDASPTGVTRSAILGCCLATALQVACLVPPAADGRILAACLRARRRRTT